jgi:predicted Rossmann fold flavoprotein
MTGDFRPGRDPAEVAVIGAGGAGLLAGIAAARAGARTVLYERMKGPAKKVAISGGGRCNFSNSLEARQFVRLFGDRNSSFLGHALRAFSRDDLTEMLARYGVEGQVERNYRLYTKSGRGLDVVQALVGELERAGGALLTSARILRIERDPGGEGFQLEGQFGESAGRHRARAVVVTTGGLSYPATGSSGDGYEWAKSFGHRVTDLRAALVGLSVEESWPRKLQGLSHDDARATLWPAEGGAAAAAESPRRPLCEERAEILFTHFGISGPAILDVSNVFVRSGLSRATLALDLFPDLSREELDRRLLEQFKRFPNRSPARALEGLLAARLVDHLVEEVGIAGELTACQLPREVRARLLERLKRTTLLVTGTRGIEYGEVTAGGIEWKDLDPATMGSRLEPGLFFAGEILDLAGRCGGFNLQAAFSTGYLAGREAARLAVAARRGS